MCRLSSLTWTRASGQPVPTVGSLRHPRFLRQPTSSAGCPCEISPPDGDQHWLPSLQLGHRSGCVATQSRIRCGGEGPLAQGGRPVSADWSEGGGLARKGGGLGNPPTFPSSVRRRTGRSHIGHVREQEHHVEGFHRYHIQSCGPRGYNYWSNLRPRR